MKKTFYTLLALALIVLVTENLFAGARNRIGTGGASELLIPVGARDLAMGGASVATTSGIDALFWNPAGVAKSKSSASILFSHMSYIADIGVEYGAATATVEGLGTLAISVKALSVGDIPVTTTANPDGTGETYSPQFFVSGLSYSRQLSDRIAVGVTANLISERLSEVNTSGIAFSVGVIYDNLAEIGGLSLGVAVKNIGPQMKYDGPGLYQLAAVQDQNRPPQYYKVDSAPFELPSTIEIGLGYKTAFSGTNSLLLAGTFQNNNFSEDEYKMGAEFAFNSTFFLRGGWTLAPTTADNSKYIFGPTVGGGIQYNLGDADISVDYAFQDTEYFSGNHTIAVRLGF